MLKTNQNITSLRNLYAFGKKLPIDLSLSENPLGYSPKVRRFIKTNEFEVNDYPDPQLKKIKTKIAEKFQLSVSNIFIGHGSESIIKLLPEIFNEGSMIVPKVTFPMFEIVGKLAGMDVVQTNMTRELDIDLKAIQMKINGKTRLIILCNPNNPTGRVIPREKILSFVRKTKAFVIVDEANIEFGGESVISDVKNIENLIVLRTFSKGFGLAGIRIGFCIASQNVIEKLEMIGIPFPVTTISIDIACIALSDDKFIQKTKRFMKKERTFLTFELEKRGFRVIKSEANNLLIDISKFTETSTQFVTKLNQKGVSVVDGASFKNLPPIFMRVSPRLRKTNMAFLSVIDSIINDL